MTDLTQSDSGLIILEFERPLAKLGRYIQQVEALQAEKGVDYSKELGQLQADYNYMLRKTYASLSAWDTILVARHRERPSFRDWADLICRDFRELHGDRLSGDDPAMVCGLARLGKHKVMLVGHHKGRDTKERVRCHFGSAYPDGHRKALRCMKLAEKFHLPVVTLIDTQGGGFDLDSERRGQSESVARNLMEMSRLRTPIVAVVCGSGGSGGALALGVADRVGMFQFAWYSVISPEGCSGILYDDSSHAGQMAQSLKLTSKDLKYLGVIDDVIAEPLGGAHRDPPAAAKSLELYLRKALADLERFKVETLLERRYEKFRSVGVYQEPDTKQAMRPAG